MKKVMCLYCQSKEEDCASYMPETVLISITWIIEAETTFVPNLSL